MEYHGKVMEFEVVGKVGTLLYQEGVYRFTYQLCTDLD